MFAPLDPSVNELYAFHGTFVRYALSIAENEACRQETPWFSNLSLPMPYWILLVPVQTGRSILFILEKHNYYCR